MLTAAAFFDSFISEKRRNEKDVSLLNGERFLQELSTAFQNGVFHQEKDDDDTVHLEDDSANTHETAINAPLSETDHSDENTLVNTRTSDSRKEDPNARATQIQAQARRYLQHRHFTIERLQQRLQDIACEKEASLVQIEQRKRRKLLKVERKYDRKEERLEVEYQKVQGIRQYLQRNQVRCQRELDNLQQITQELLKENQRLLRGNERTNTAVHDKQQQLKVLEASNHRLSATLEVYKEVAQQLRLQIPSSRTPTAVDLSNVRRNNHPHPHHSHSKPYETNIVVNSVNEVEEKCFHYRLVQDVYTLTPRTII